MYLTSGKKAQCCGCAGCEKICPKQAIHMDKDAEGFKYPIIDHTKCIRCGLCEKVCPFTRPNGINTHTTYDQKIYAFKHHDSLMRKYSSSGGAFSALADIVLDRGGVICGCAFDRDYRAKHVCIQSRDALDDLRKSKYVQSDLKNVFLDIKMYLQKEKWVLFTGTSCQAAALQKYLDNSKTDRKYLFICDLVCHGVPSPQIWQEYLNEMKKKLEGPIKEVCFRYKDEWGGWTPLQIFIRSDHKKYRAHSSNNEFYRLFFDHYILRPSCHECPFTSFDRVSDITIADFWGIEKAKPEFSDDLGVSLVMINTSQGERLFRRLDSRHKIEASSKEQCVQPNLQHPAPPNPERQDFWDTYQKFGIKKAIKKYGQDGLTVKIKYKCSSILRRLHLLKTVKALLKRR